MQTRSSGVASRLTQETPTAARADGENPGHLQAAGPNTGQAEEAWVRPVQAALGLHVTDRDAESWGVQLQSI